MFILPCFNLRDEIVLKCFFSRYKKKTKKNSKSKKITTKFQHKCLISYGLVTNLDACDGIFRH